MKYFKAGNWESAYENEAIRLEDNIFSISVIDKNKVKIMEDCDAIYYKEFTKEEAIEMFEEAIEWIKANVNNEKPK